MKNFKNLVLLMAFGICSFFLFGVGKVFAGIQSPNIVCDPASIEAGQTADCVLYGKFANNDEYYAIAMNIGLEDLEWVDKNSPEKSIVSGWDNVSVEYLSGTGKSFNTDHIKDSTGGALECKNNNNISITPQVCALLYSNSQTAKNVKNKTSKREGFTIIATFKVRLLKNAEVKKCGKICVVGTSYAAYTFTKGSDDASFANQDKNKNCNEISVLGDPDPTPVPTGNFTSYVILAAGAFIAICAVLVAKKNNRFYRV